MRKQYRAILAFLLTLVMAFTLLAIPAFAEENRTEPSTVDESVDPVEEPVEDHTPLDGNWCSDEQNHWRADAVNQGIPAPHVDDDKDGICDVCGRILSADEPIEEPVEVTEVTPLDGNWCSDEQNHWRADAVNQGIPAPHVDDDKDGICDVCQRVLSIKPIEQPSDSSENTLSTTPSDDVTVPETADNSDLALWSMMLLLSAAGLTVVALTTRRRSKM